MFNGETVICFSIFQRRIEAVPPDNPSYLIDFEREMSAPHHRIAILFIVHGRSSEQLNVERRASLTCFLHVFTKNVTNAGFFQVGIEHRQHAEHTFLAHRGIYRRVQGRQAAMTDTPRELSRADFRRALSRKLRERMVRGDFRTGADVRALRPKLLGARAGRVFGTMES